MHSRRIAHGLVGIDSVVLSGPPEVEPLTAKLANFANARQSFKSHSFAHDLHAFGIFTSNLLVKDHSKMLLPGTSPLDKLEMLHANILEAQRTEFADVAEILQDIFSDESPSAAEVDERFYELRRQAETERTPAGAI
jgi:hypothetical protein